MDLSELRFVGVGLQRPECVVATSDGTLHVSDWRGGVTRIAADRTQTTVIGRHEAALRPNGIAVDVDGSYLIAHLGDDTGGVFRLHPDGRVEAVVDEVDGRPLPPTNFVHFGPDGRVWVTVSTRRRPRQSAYRSDVADGFIVQLADGVATIVADDLGYTNEARVDPTEQYLYVNETFARRLSRFPITPTGLGTRETIARFGEGTYPDGLEFDQRGGIWVTSIISNRLLRIDAEGEVECVLADADPAEVEEVERRYVANELTSEDLNAARGTILANISSLAFGGPDRRQVYLGCLGGERLATFRSPYPGPASW
ncbi:sugar lactone lactonase YvrE [Ilumatobacter fluminis]|uniref:Sugar lactone lactonase YvrE n=1 Tax=Ilumatobacter fluminis TaxID=467091 RepID=A0A4V6Q1V2_9ACTN|nr:sugar lactone lactonase YvrE [Ilumatobacter fluminis]